MVFIETSIFTKKYTQYLSDDEYRKMQIFLLNKPDVGVLIPGTGGLRKVRWSLDNKGKSGGIRIIYYWEKKKHQIYLMTIYAKNEKVDLSSSEKKIIKQMVERWKL
jgi:mRNA-degrading endonuclease RelE of RelBE toxin-antitoxin system